MSVNPDDTLTRRRARLGLACLALACAASLSQQAAAGPPAAPNVMDLARSVAARAQSLALADKVAEAINLVNERSASTEDRQAKSLLEFTRGWLHHRQASHAIKAGDVETAQGQWWISADAYRGVLEAYPENQQVRENLARVYVAHGDLLARLDQPNEAYELYEKAFQARPEAEHAPARLVDLYDRLQPSWPDRFFSLCQRFEDEELDRIARRGYAKIIRRSLENPDQERFAVRSLERWTELAALGGSLSSSALQELPAADEWPHAGLVELTQVVKNIEENPDERQDEENPDERQENPDERQDVMFWRESPLRMHILAAASLALGEAAERIGKLERAEQIYQHTRVSAPEFVHYGEFAVLEGRPMVALDAASNLARLYHTHPKLDAGEEFLDLKNELLVGKNQSYLKGDLPTIEKFHTVLGVLFAERGLWRPKSEWEAPYHLQRAVEVAQKLAGRETGEYQPLPHLSRMLGDGLRGDHDYRDPERARQAYLNAAIGYLNLDALNEAGEVLSWARELSQELPNAEPLNRLQLLELEGILRKRKEILELPSPKLDRELGRLDVDETWNRAVNAGLDPSFVQRQYGRALSDLAGVALRAGRFAETRVLQERALQTVIGSDRAIYEDVRRILRGPGPGLNVSPDFLRPTGEASRNFPSTVILNERDRQRLARAVAGGKLRIAGGPGGKSFEDRVEAGWRIAAIVVRAGDMVDAIQLHSISGRQRQEHPVRGGPRGKVHIVRLQPDEHVTGLSGRFGRYVRVVTVHTNKGKHGPYGTKRSDGQDRPFDLRVPEGHRVVGFRGRCGDRLDAIGLITEPVE